MLKLYQFPGPWDVCSASPFCSKLEAFLRWQNISYTPVTVMGMKGSPKGKIPYIEDENGKLGDSNFIIGYLIKKYNLNPDESLTNAQIAEARAFRYLCEESLYWATVYFRWIDPNGWKIIKGHFLSRFPAFLRPLIEWKIQGYVRKQMYMQGMGRHSADEIVSIAMADLQALSDFLGNKSYFFGDTMHTLDLVVFSMVSNFLVGPFDNPVMHYAKQQSNLVAHTERVRTRCFMLPEGMVTS